MSDKDYIKMETGEYPKENNTTSVKNESTHISITKIILLVVLCIAVIILIFDFIGIR